LLCQSRFFEQPRDGGQYLLIVRILHLFSGCEHQKTILRYIIKQREKCLFHTAFDAVALHAVAELFGYRKTHLQMRCSCRHIYQHHVSIRNGFASSVYISKFFVAPQRIFAPQCFPSINAAYAQGRNAAQSEKSRRLIGSGKALSGKLFSSLCPSAFEHIPSGLGFHSLPKPMNLFALPLFGL